MFKRKLTRRSVLRGGAGIAVALPFLEIMGRSKTAHGALEGGARRLIIMYTPHGRHRESNGKWRPSQTGSNFELASLMTPLQPFKDRMIHLSGLPMETCRNQNGNSHSRGAMHALTCSFHDEGAFLGNAISIDQKIANEIAKVEQFKFPSLQFGVQATTNFAKVERAKISYAGPKDPIGTDSDPQSVFDRLFGADFEGGEGSQEDPAVAQLRAERRSVLDFVMEDFERVNPTLGHGDQMRLDKHLTTIREIEQSIDAGVAPGQACASPSYDPDAGDPYDVKNYPTVGRQMSKLVAMALACEMTPVALFQWSTGQCSTRHTWLGGEAGESGFHGITHFEEKQATYDAITGWYVERVADLLGDLDELQEGDGSVLDNSVVLWIGGEQGSALGHSFDDMPYALFGSGGGVLQTGQHLEFNGRTANDLMVTVQNAMGIDDDSFGEQEFVTGALPGILA